MAAVGTGIGLKKLDYHPADHQQAHVDVGVVELLADYYDRKDPARARTLRLQSAERLEKAGETSAAMQVMRPLQMQPLPPPEPD